MVGFFPLQNTISSAFAIQSKHGFIDAMIADTGHYFPNEKNAALGGITVLLQCPPVVKILHYVELSAT